MLWPYVKNRSSIGYVQCEEEYTNVYNRIFLLTQANSIFPGIIEYIMPFLRV